MRNVLVSACLVGEPVRHDGAGKLVQHPVLERWAHEGRLVRLCPEVAGGLGVPRPPAEIVGGTGDDVLSGRASVRTVQGDDVTAAFVRGAEATLAQATAHRVALAILKTNSPSCGARAIYDGTHRRRLRDGRGVAAAALVRAGILVFGEDELDAAAAALAAIEADDARAS
jgi:uncharacterized protein YbbK (DUF523 family)